MSASSLSFRLAVLFALIGIILGVYMASSHNHTLGQAHAHINLIGWVSLFLIGLFYERRPQFDKSAGARWQVIIYTIGAVMLNASMAALLLGNAGAEPGAAAGSILVLGSMLWFGWLVFRNVDARG
jgi:peptidoglycan biosynthesis protein MviN/MurJ (putative lipid II flippase)